MRMTLEHMQDIYSKLNNYNFDCLNLSSKEVNTHKADSKKMMQRRTFYPIQKPI
jgi:hypothetical protein